MYELYSFTDQSLSVWFRSYEPDIVDFTFDILILNMNRKITVLIQEIINIASAFLKIHQKT